MTQTDASRPSTRPSSRPSARLSTRPGETAPSAISPQTIQAQELSYPVDVSIRSMLGAGAHFGHQTDKWNPKMLPYIYTAKNGIHIINLDLSLDQFKRSRQYLVDTISQGGSVLFVGTKQQAREVVQREAERCGAFSVVTRWLGGMLSNFQTIKNSIDRMRRLEDLLEKSNQDTSQVKLSKKEKLDITREIEKLERSLGGIRNMKKPPDVVFVVDIIKEAIAVAEAHRLHIPVIALVDTNVDPESVDFPIACNDDSSRTIRLMVAAVADAVLEGKTAWEARRPKDLQPAAAAPQAETPGDGAGHADPAPNKENASPEGV
jgi:small subunit ribosomal protein S2